MQTIKTHLIETFDKYRPRRGNIILLSAGVIVMTMGFAAFSIDIGYLAVAKGQLQAAVDAATLAAAMELNPNIDQTVVESNVKAAATEIAGLNPVGNHSGLLLDPAVDIELGRRDWDSGNSTFVFNFGPQAVPYNIVRVTGRLDSVFNAGTGQTEDRRLPMFFAPAINHENVTLKVGSVATYQPRDMIITLDFSGSMNDDSEFKSCNELGHAWINSAIDQMWTELGQPSYGNMPYAPTYLTVEGVPEDPGNNIPHITVTYRGDEVDVTSTMSLSKVVLKDSSGGYLTFDNLSGTTGVFQDNKKIRRVWVKSGSNANISGDTDGERFEYDDADIVEYLDLDTVTYPHPSGSWTSFVDYVNDSGNVGEANYRYMYGTKCLINYWNEQKPMYSQTTGLSVCSTQPLTAAKTASDVLCDYIAMVEADDQVGLSIYTHSSSNGAILESGLTNNVASIKPLYRNRQAGHYDNMTNIGGGLKVAREELENNGRQDAYRVIVLMTDGVANRPSSNPEQWAIDQANLCKASKIKIMAIALGLGADQDLMLQLAEITGGKRFIVPGGGTIAQYQAELMQVFQEIAADRPLKLLPSGY
ncbi:MAG: VWA domain-containing protein [Planctomycetota bacterium]|nr:VWA domain-containing protein [Planctomycetota bacterium]MDA1163355.1 VWA domain-containing protein [Planctomycetota bacterium]